MSGTSTAAADPHVVRWGGFELVDEFPVDTERARVFEHGWQSWSPTSYRPSDPALQIMCFRPDAAGPPSGFQGEGLLAVDPGDGPPRLYAAADGRFTVPSIRASLVDGRMVVSANGPVVTSAQTLDEWASGYATTAGVRALCQPPSVWCSWYHYYTGVTEADVLDNVAAIRSRRLPIDVVQIDDGWQAEIGDWLDLSDRFTSLPDIAHRIRDAGLRPGIWIAPYLVGARSRLAADRPEWLLTDTTDQTGARPVGAGPVAAGHNWDQPLYALDTTHPGAAAYLADVFGALREAGFDYVKLDFLYAGALDGRRHDGSTPLVAYRRALEAIRAAAGPDTYLLGSGAPMLPSVGLVDAMRVGPDVGPTYEPAHGDLTRPSQRAATMSTVARAFTHGRLWVNDPDCLLARPGIERREEWAATIERYGGLRSSGDRISALDEWGLATTERLLGSIPPPTPFR
jgi:alpha-galactosidase